MLVQVRCLRKFQRKREVGASPVLTLMGGPFYNLTVKQAVKKGTLMTYVWGQTCHKTV